MQTYVVGFLFSPDKKHVALIRKTKPDWMRGKLNGIGGKIEPSDGSPLAAMIREFEEETGRPTSGWGHYAALCNENARVEVFRLFAQEEIYLDSTTDETVAWTPVNKLEKQACMPELRWLIPLAFDNRNFFVEGNF